jgi:hypothetical protein
MKKENLSIFPEGWSEKRKWIATSVPISFIIFWVIYMGVFGNRKFLKEDIEKQFEGVIIGKAEPRHGGYRLEYGGHYFNSPGILSHDLTRNAEIGDTIIKLKGSMCILKSKKGRLFLNYLDLSAY